MPETVAELREERFCGALQCAGVYGTARGGTESTSGSGKTANGRV
ncbi:hypothetical protein [Rhodococcus sp. H29-C3]|nr:hypothetical protein [Rhodococcus sp. H29-C3]MDJ0363283.1 hypothetical protein [Rhodococcus sp. H29-C3]